MNDVREQVGYLSVKMMFGKKEGKRLMIILPLNSLQ